MQRNNIQVKLDDSDEHRRQLATGINKLNLTLQLRGSINLPAAGSIVIEDRNIGQDAVGVFTPADSNAASTDFYAVATNGQIELFNAAGLGGLFNYLIIL